jgi:hypothetical protein
MYEARPLISVFFFFFGRLCHCSFGIRCLRLFIRILYLFILMVFITALVSVKCIQCPATRHLICCFVNVRVSVVTKL